MNRNLILGITLLTILAMPMVQAQQQNQNMGIPPDSPFYFMQGWSEGFSGMFRGGDPEFHEELAMRRQAEISYLQEKGEEGLIERLRLRERAQEHQEEAQRIRERIRQENPETGQGPNENQGESQGEGGQGSGEQETGSGTQGNLSQVTGEGGGQTGNFMLLVSDAPADIDDFDSLVVSFSNARIFSVENQSEGFDEYSLEGTSVDLTQVVGEKSISVMDVELEEGTYNKVEMHVSGVEGIVNGTQVEVMVPSNKLQIVRPFEIKSGETTKFVFDINVVKKGQSDEYNLLPVIGKSGVVGKDLQEEEIEEEECTVDEDCNEGEMCVDGECLKTEEVECTTDQDCEENETCVEGECEPLE